MVNIFMGGEEVVDGERVAVKDVGKREHCLEGVRRYYHPCPLENFHHTVTIIIPSQCNSHAMTGNWTINEAWSAESKAN